MRLIDADALINDRETFIVIGAGDNICIDIADIANAPTIEAKPVVHGEWEETVITYYDCFGEEEWDDFYYEHKECGYQCDSKFNFCPNCGADMRERKET